MRYGYETSDSIGRGTAGELRGRETMAGRQRYSDIGRPRGAGRAAAGRQDAATRGMHDDWQTELMKLKTRLLQLEQTG